MFDAFDQILDEIDFLSVAEGKQSYFQREGWLGGAAQGLFQSIQVFHHLGQFIALKGGSQVGNGFDITGRTGDHLGQWRIAATTFLLAQMQSFGHVEKVLAQFQCHQGWFAPLAQESVHGGENLLSITISHAFANIEKHVFVDGTQKSKQVGHGHRFFFGGKQGGLV